MKNSQNNGRVIIGNETCLRFKKRKPAKKEKWFKISQFSVNFPKKNMIYTKKTLVNWYLNIL